MNKKCVLCFIICSILLGQIYGNSFNLTEKPIFLPAGTDGSKGTEAQYVLFGDWPQTLKESDVTVEDSKTIINGWECYKGSDDHYYVKVTAAPYKDKDIYKFNDGTSVIKGNEYYFKFEPIKWCIINSNYQGHKLLLADKALINSCYYTSYGDRLIEEHNVLPNNYKYSTIRALLNSLDGSSYNVDDFTTTGFITKGFTKEAIELIKSVTVDNGDESTADSKNNFSKASDFASENTTDKIFILSAKESTSEDFGFIDYDQFDASKEIDITDYLKAVGGFSIEKDKYLNNSWWWLRSPYYSNKGFAQCVFYDGSLLSNLVKVPSLCIIPALCL